MAEKRFDADDGKSYTFEELSGFFEGRYKKGAIRAYWDSLKLAPKGGRGRAKAEPSSEERRVDTDDGKSYSFQELSAFYKKTYTKAAIQGYWDSLKAGRGGRAAPKAKVKAQAAEAAEKRIDPDDGKSYTFEEICAHYKSKFKKAALQAYWDDVCKVKGKKKPKAKAKREPRPPKTFESEEEERAFHKKRASNLVDKEQARRVKEHEQASKQHENDRKKNQKQAKKAVDQEQKRRVKEWEKKDTEAQNERVEARKGSIKALDEEQQRRISEHGTSPQKNPNAPAWKALAGASEKMAESRDKRSPKK